MDITHYGGRIYLTLIDWAVTVCCLASPATSSKCKASIIPQLEAVFYERGAPGDLLTENDNSFRIKQFAELPKQ